jgi:Flp pilus assembly protein protease CpaA
MERPKRDWAKLVRYSNHLAVVSSLVISLAIVAISSKNHGVNSLWFVVAAFGLPIPIVLYLETRLGGFGTVLLCSYCVTFGRGDPFRNLTV